MFSIHAVIVSHEHMDHLDPAFLRGPAPKTAPLRDVVCVADLVAQAHPNCRADTADPPHRQGSRIGDVDIRTWTEISPMNQDSVWLFKHGGRSIVHTVDSRLGHEQLGLRAAVVQRTCCLSRAREPAGIPSSTRTTTTRRSTPRAPQTGAEALYVRAMADHLRPKTVVVAAGPPAFGSDDRDDTGRHRYRLRQKSSCSILGSRTYRADDVGPDMVSEIRHFWAATIHPAPNENKENHSPGVCNRTLKVTWRSLGLWAEQ